MGQESPSPGDRAGREQRARRARGLLQRCETPDPCRSLSLGRGRLPGSPERWGGTRCGPPGRARALTQILPFPAGSSPADTGKHLPAPCKPTGLHHGLAARQGQGVRRDSVSPPVKWGESPATQGQRGLSLSSLQCPGTDPCQVLFIDQAVISGGDTLPSDPASRLQPLPQGHWGKHRTQKGSAG